MRWLSPFKRYKLEDFDAAFVPLHQATRHLSVTAKIRHNSVDSFDHAAGEDGTSRSVKEKGSLDSNESGFTIESLRAEIEADMPSYGHDTVYDRKSKVIDRAIHDVGMGPYQWQLFAFSGLGWFADNMCRFSKTENEM